MKLCSPFAIVFTVLLTVGPACFSAFSQTPPRPRPGAPPPGRPTQQQNGQNAMRPGPNAGAAPGANPGLGPEAGNLNNLPPRAIDRLREMAPEQQEKFLQNNQRFRSLPPEQQAEIRQRLQQWNSLTPGQRQEMRAREQVWERMTPQQRNYVRQALLPQWQQLPPRRRQAINQRLRSLRNLSETEREARLNDPNFYEGLNPEDRKTLNELARLHVGTAPD